MCLEGLLGEVGLVSEELSEINDSLIDEHASDSSS